MKKREILIIEIEIKMKKAKGYNVTINKLTNKSMHMFYTILI